jgi:hypothetical protein
VSVLPEGTFGFGVAFGTVVGRLETGLGPVGRDVGVSESVRVGDSGTAVFVLNSDALVEFEFDSVKLFVSTATASCVGAGTGVDSGVDSGDGVGCGTTDAAEKLV